MARVRSPNYPAFSLPEAIGRIKTIHTAEQHLAAPKAVIAKHLGYGGMNGASIKAISALNKYGLLEEVSSDRLKVSPLALSILFPASEEEKVAAIREAAFKPPLFAEISAEWDGGQPSAENLRVYLIRRNFAADALDRVIQSYRETMELVTQESGGYSLPNPPAAAQVASAAEATPMQPARQIQPQVGHPPAGEPYRISILGGRIQGSFDLATTDDTDEMIRALTAVKALLKPKEAAH